MTTAVVVRHGGVADAMVAGGALAVSAVLTLLAPVLGVVHAADGSPTWFAPGALWVMLLPVILTVVVALRRPVGALAVAAGTGVLGAVHLLADLSVVLSPDSLARPDLYVETTDRSLPFHPGPGGYLVLVADAVALAAGIFAALRLTGRLTLRRRSDLAESADGWRSDADDPDEPPRRNNLMIAAGFLGVLLLAVGALTESYQGGYLTGRYVAVGVPLVGLVAAVLLVVLAGTAVLIAGSLPRALALALLGGVALGACLPFLAAVVAVVTAPVQLSVTVWLGLAGGVLVAAAGMLTRVTMIRDAGPDRLGDPVAKEAAPSRVTAVLAGVGGIVAALLAAAAFALPPLDAGGFEDVLVLADGSALPGATLFGAAAIPLVVAGVLALVPWTANAGRAVLMVVWAALVPALCSALQVLGDEGISTALLLHLVGIGSGTWCGVAALGVAAAAAVLAAVTSRRAADASSAVPDDESVASVRSVTVPVALVAAVLTVIAALLPVYGTAGEIQGPTILRGYAVDAWGVWAQLLATVGALAGAAVTRRRGVALALGLAAAAVQAIRLVVPTGASDAAGFGLRAGFVVQAVLVLALVASAAVLAVQAGRVTELDAAGFDAAFREDRASSLVAPAVGGKTARGRTVGAGAVAKRAGRAAPRSRRRRR